MSKGKAKRSARKSASKSLEQRVSGSSGSANKSAYSSKSSNKKGKKNADKAGGLEAKLKNTNEAVKSLVERLIKSGMSKTDASRLAAQFYAGQQREGNYKLHLDINSWFKMINKYMKEGKITVGRLIQTAYQLFLGLTDLPDASRNPYKDIEEAAADGETPAIFVTGLWGIPANTYFLEKHSGKPMVHLNTIDPRVIQHYARLILAKTGSRPDVFGYSDGAETTKRYLLKFGYSHINHIYAYGAMPLELNPSKQSIERYTDPRLTYIIEDKPVITALEKRFPGMLKMPGIRIPYDHLSPFYEKECAELIGRIMDNGPKRANFKRSALITSEEIEAVNKPFEIAGPYDFRKAA
ncbi:hypothetical protein GF323_02470 [Candidatus Woesearchaeota archaeon]|nr:hypothetical protein [Candidatus Woesearchaeota archaeon]